MLRVGLTGGVACGKSTVGQMFAERGVHLLRADELAHELMQPGKPVYDQVVAAFGRSILHSGGSIDRARLAQLAFSGGRVQELNRLVHPAVLERQQQWMDDIGRRDPSAIAMVEAALIVEAGAQSQFDKLIVVTCRPEQKIERYAPRTGGDWEAARAEVERRSAAQLSDEEKARAADYVIDNSGSLEHTRQQVARILSQLGTTSRPSAP